VLRVADLLEQQPDSLAPHFILGLAHRGQRHTQVLSHVDVIVPGHGQVVRHRQAAFLDRADGADRNQVAAAADRARAGPVFEQPAHSIVAGRDIRLTVMQRVVAPVQAGFPERAPVTGDPALSALRFPGQAEKANRVPARLNQVADNLVAALLVVVGDAVDRNRPAGAHQEHQGNAEMNQRTHLAVIRVQRRSQKQPVDPLV